MLLCVFFRTLLMKGAEDLGTKMTVLKYVFVFCVYIFDSVFFITWLIKRHFQGKKLKIAA